MRARWAAALVPVMLVCAASGCGAPKLEALWTAESNQAGAWFGGAVSTAGDVDGDGYDDIVVGSRYDNGATLGRAYVYRGSATGLGSEPAWTAESSQPDEPFEPGQPTGDEFATHVASAGDVNADGYADVLVSAPSFQNVSNLPGRVYLYSGSIEGLAPTPTWEAEGRASYSGMSIA